MTDTQSTINAENNAREKRYAIAEGLLNHIEDHLRLHGGKLRGCLTDDVVRCIYRAVEEALDIERKKIKETDAYKIGFQNGSDRMREVILKDIEWLKSQYKTKEGPHD